VVTSAVWRRLLYRPEPREKLHEYWRAPWDGDNQPESYVEGADRSRFLLDLLQRHVGPDASVLELGCNVGRNLAFLLEHGYRDLQAIELSEGALDGLRRFHPEVAVVARLHHGTLEEILPTLPGNSVDVVFSLAVLEHIHTDSDWIFPHIVRVARTHVVTVENERVLSWRHFPRNYRDVFEPLGLTQVGETSAGDVPRTELGGPRLREAHRRPHRRLGINACARG
jgi:SAM-dependent methyltransferase